MKNRSIPAFRKALQVSGLYVVIGVLFGMNGFASLECQKTLRVPVQDIRDSSARDVSLADQFSKRGGTISNLMSASGKVLLFRSITAPKYIKDFSEINPFKDQVVGFSYSMNPKTPLNWTYYGDDDQDLILVAWQEVMQLVRLVFTNGMQAERLDISTPFLWVSWEVKVPREIENVIAIMRKRDFRPIAESPANDTILDLASAIAEDSNCQVPKNSE